MSRPRWAGLAAFVAWTVFVWGNRLSNTLRGDESTGGKVLSSVLSLVFLGLAVGGVVVLVRTWRSPLTVGAARFLQGFVVLTVAVWLVRVPQILLAEHDVPFKVVHTVLGLVAVALAVGVWRTATPVATARRPVAPGRPAAPYVGAGGSTGDAGRG